MPRAEKVRSQGSPVEGARRRARPLPGVRNFDRDVAARGGRMAAREREAVPRCWFCPTTDAKGSKEHIFARWLTGELGVRDVRVTPTRTDPFGNELDSRSPRPFAGLVARGVCEPCNNGWMSSLETHVEPVLMAGAREGSLSGAEAETLARWFAKTAAVLNVSQNYRMVLRKADRHALSSGLPANVAVGLARCSRVDRDIDWQQGAAMAVLVPEGMSREYVRDLAERTLVVGIQVADLVASVVFAARPMDAEAVRGFKGAVALWPSGDPLRWGEVPIVESVSDVFPHFAFPRNPFVIGG